MGAIDGIPLLLQTAKAMINQTIEAERETLKIMQEQGGFTFLVNSLRSCAVQMEIACVGAFSLFEARMQKNFPKNRFFIALRDHLIKVGEEKLGEDLYRYYLAVNVLKHGLGSSYDELNKLKDLPFVMKKHGDWFDEEGDVAEPEALIDYRNGEFFAGMIETLGRAFCVLEPEETWRFGDAGPQDAN